MVKLSYEIHVKSGDAELSYNLSDGPVIIGSAPACHLFLMGEGPEIKAIIQREAEFVIVKIFDKNFSLLINDKSYGSAKFRKSTNFHLDKFNFELSITERKDNLNDTSTHHLPEFKDFSEEKKLPTTPISDVNTILPESSPVSTSIMLDSTKPLKEPTIKKTHTPLNTQSEGSDEVSLDDIINFNIVFDKVEVSINQSESYADKSLSFKDYINLEDDSIVKVPTPDIHKKSNSQSIHAVYMNNGTTLNEKYFSLSQKRIFLSNRIDRKNYFTAFDAASSKDEFIFIKDNAFYVVTPVGHSVHKSIGDEFIQLEENTNRLLFGEKLIFTKDESQIVLSICETPAKIKKAQIFDVEDKLLKTLAISWSFAFLFIFSVLLFDKEVQQEKKKDLVVILKRKQVEKLDKTPTPPSQEVAKSEVEIEKPQEVVPPETEKIVAKKPEIKPEAPKANEMITKKTVKPPKVKKIAPVKKVLPDVAVTPVKAVVAKKSPVKTPKAKKKFSFGFGRKMKSLVTKAEDTNLKKSNSKSLDMASSIKSAEATGSNFNTSKIGKTNSKISRFTAGKIAGKAGAIGTQGLSGKTDTQTAYLEANTKILGALDPELIRKIMREYIPQFRHCYQRELVINPKVAGVFDLEFQINAKGKGVNVGVKKKGQNFTKSGVNCLKKVVNLI